MRWRDDIPEPIKEERLQKLLKLQDEIYAKHRQQMLNTTVEVLVERRNAKDDAFLKGRTRCWKNVLFKGGDELIGTLQQVAVHSYSHQTLIGDVQ
jgi:tRNA-2-methylthio-N6-dimethylallyladenosine synthase